MCPLSKRRQWIQGTGHRPAHINLDSTDLATGEARIREYRDAFGRDGTRITRNLDLDLDS